MVRHLVRSLVAFGLIVSVQSSWAADPVPPYSTLASRRALIAVPVYTAGDKQTVVSQAQVLLKDLYVHREKKIALHGEGVDPLPLLDELATDAPRISEMELHQRLEHIFDQLRDLHTNYYYPKPYSCYRSVLPFSLSLTADAAGKAAIAVRSIVTDAGILGLSPGIEQVHVGDVIESYDGMDPIQAARALLEVGAGANDAAGLRRGIQNLTLRSQKMHAFPAYDTVKFDFKSRTGVGYSVELPWILKADLVCLGQEPAPAPPNLSGAKLDLGTDDYQIEYEKLYKPEKPRSKMHSLTTTPTPEPIVSYSVLNNEYGTYGYLRLDSFEPTKVGDDGTIAIIKGLLGKEFKDTDGLVIDLRDNGGGSIGLAETLIQLFTPNDIAPQGFRLLNTPLNHFIYQNGNQTDEVFSEALGRADALGARYTDAENLTSVGVANSLGQSYFKPVAVLTNSACFSACDMFTAHMQDDRAAVIYGEDASTGGGGANVVAHSDFLKMFPQGQSGEFAPLPGGQDMRVAWRQTIRSGKNAGKLIEDDGVTADHLALLSLSDFYSDDSQQIRTITADLNRVSAAYTSEARLDSEDRVDLKTGQPITFGATLASTTAVEFLASGRSLGIQQIGSGAAPVHVEMTVPGIQAGSLGNLGSIELLGYFTGAREWRKQVSYRVVPAPVVLQATQSITNDLSQNSDPLQSYTEGGTAADGWIVREGKLRVGQGPNYLNNLKTEAALFVDLANKPSAKLSFNAEVHTEKDYDFFQVQVFVDGKHDDLFKPMSGDSPETPYTFDLSPYSGKKIEIRFTFTSDAGVNSTGPTVDHLVLQ